MLADTLGLYLYDHALSVSIHRKQGLPVFVIAPRHTLLRIPMKSSAWSGGKRPLVPV